MKIKTAIKILKHHNDWMRGSEIAPYNSKELVIAIETLINYAEKQTCNESKK